MEPEILLFLLAAIVVVAALEYSRKRAAAAEIETENLATQFRQQAAVRMEDEIKASLIAHPQYVKALYEIASRTIVIDLYGDIDSRRWEKELTRFAEQKLLRWTSNPYYKVSPDYVVTLDSVLRELWRREGRADPSSPIPRPTGTEFELRCEAVFRSNGYIVRHIGASGDQGADLIIERDGERGVVQCKAHNSSIGNAAVQQAAAARAFHDAQYALVVSAHAHFTTSARELAKKVNVRLLEFAGLHDYLTD